MNKRHKSILFASNSPKHILTTTTNCLRSLPWAHLPISLGFKQTYTRYSMCRKNEKKKFTHPHIQSQSPRPCQPHTHTNIYKINLSHKKCTLQFRVRRSSNLHNFHTPPPTQIPSYTISFFGGSEAAPNVPSKNGGYGNRINLRLATHNQEVGLTKCMCVSVFWLYVANQRIRTKRRTVRLR